MKILIAYLAVAIAASCPDSHCRRKHRDRARRADTTPAMKQRVAGMTAATQVTVWGAGLSFLATSPTPVSVVD